MYKLKHLKNVRQTYRKHFKDSIKYSWISLKCSFYFLCHAINPDSNVEKGSESINLLDKEIKGKYKELKRKI